MNGKHSRAICSCPDSVLVHDVFILQRLLPPRAIGQLNTVGLYRLTSPCLAFCRAFTFAPWSLLAHRSLNYTSSAFQP